MAASLAALASAGVTGVAVELWWGVVERGGPREYDWAGYLDLAAMARRCGLRVRAILAFHQCGAGPQDSFWYVPLLPSALSTPICLLFSRVFHMYMRVSRTTLLPNVNELTFVRV